MFETNLKNKIKLYFTQDNICIGSYDEIHRYEQETGKSYWASEYFQIPTDYNPVGKTAQEIQAADRQLFVSTVAKYIKSPHN
jgi:hypothetical protein